MKNIFKYSVLALAATLSAASCSFLEEKQPMGLSETYSTKEMLESSINGILSTCYGSNGFLGEPHEFFTYASNLWSFTPTVNSKVKNYKYLAPLRFGMYSEVTQNGDLYTSIFKGINACNVLIDRCATSPVEAKYRAQIASEAKFYRAVFYLYAVQFWGDLPLRTASATAQNAPGIPRSPYYKIYGQIVKDLEEAEAGMRTPEEVRKLTPGSIRPNKFAATAYLAKTYLTIGSLLRHPDDNFWNPAKEGRKPDFAPLGINNAEDAFKLALENAEKLIPGSPTHDPLCEYELTNNFAELFDFGFGEFGNSGWDNKEQIFVLSISPKSLRSYVAERTLPRHPTGSICTDSSKGSSNSGRYRPNRFLFYRWCEDNGPETPDEPSSSVATYIDCADPRMKISLFYSEVEDISTGKITTIYPATTACSNQSDIAVFPYLRKYNSSTFNSDNGDANFYMMRFAEVYYIAAEAEAEINNTVTTKARAYIDCVHARARRSKSGEESEYPNWAGRTFADKDEFVTAIFWDRMYEFVGEWQEWGESHRHGATWISETLGKPLNAFLDLPENKKWRETTYAFPSGFRYETDVQTLRRALLASFPQEGIMYSSAITFEDQNDYYYQ